ncbi:MAG TPA: threonine synthase [Rhodospirillaceae bacterium]|nr:threonine synthase [Magnetovibrio sp.]HBT43168.1 threonine synthase [Rhodospirillaceae bacterium]HCS69725.1 threonine synthase [Rhodospirillaceae bacterium]|tara:strand:- start:4156 stop:5556 length:1401 start_codon:yes stop_codon:yes gene_type:complete
MTNPRYISTRGEAPALGFEDVLLAGLARDGGLYVPETWPQFSADDIRAMKNLSYPALAQKIMAPFIGDAIPAADLKTLVEDAYATFDAPDVLPLKKIGDGEYLLELFHGPTLAFKDVAMQVLGRFFDYVLKKRGQRITIVGATSGDTGSAAIEACRDKAAIDIFMLHPHGRVSPVQEAQMTSVQAANVHNIAIEGTFDDCQDRVKDLFNDGDFRDRFNLSAVNSINWARVMAQIVYYFWAAVKLGAPDKPVAFSVPTGNFGNVFAGYGAMQMGLPIAKLVVGSNANDILARFFASGAMEMAGVVPTTSPSMDIQVSSNFERLLFDLVDRDGAACARVLTDFRKTGRFEVSADQLARARKVFAGARFNDAGTKEIIKQVHDATGELIDPHSAIGVGAARENPAPDGTPMVILATAHPAKFPDAVEDATGQRPSLPARLADLLDRPKRCQTLANDLDQLKRTIESTLA